MVASAESARQMERALVSAEGRSPVVRALLVAVPLVVLATCLVEFRTNLVMAALLGAALAAAALVVMRLLVMAAARSVARTIAPEGARLRAGFWPDGRLWFSHGAGWHWAHWAGVEKVHSTHGHTVLSLANGRPLAIPHALFREEDLANFCLQVGSERPRAENMLLPPVSGEGTRRWMKLHPQAHDAFARSTQRAFFAQRPVIVGLGLLALMVLVQVVAMASGAGLLTTPFVVAIAVACGLLIMWRKDMRLLAALRGVAVRTTFCPEHLFVETPLLGESWPYWYLNQIRQHGVGVYLAHRGAQLLALPSAIAPVADLTRQR